MTMEQILRCINSLTNVGIALSQVEVKGEKRKDRRIDA